MQTLRTHVKKSPTYLLYTIISIAVVLFIIPFRALKRLLTRDVSTQNFEALEIEANKGPITSFYLSS